MRVKRLAQDTTQCPQPGLEPGLLDLECTNHYELLPSILSDYPTNLPHPFMHRGEKIGIGQV